MIFKLPPSERLNQWKLFRKNLNEMPLDEAVANTEFFWQQCPFRPFYLDIDDINNWPNPWELIEENYYCDLAKTLGIVYTLHLTNHGIDLDPEIRIYHDNKSNYTYHIAYLCRGKYVLNLIEGEILNKKHITQQLTLKYQFTAANLRLEQY